MGVAATTGNRREPRSDGARVEGEKRDGEAVNDADDVKDRSSCTWCLLS
jgi:hypothetical protein